MNSEHDRYVSVRWVLENHLSSLEMVSLIRKQQHCRSKSPHGWDADAVDTRFLIEAINFSRFLVIHHNFSVRHLATSKRHRLK